MAIVAFQDSSSDRIPQAEGVQRILSPRQKAAVIARLLADEGDESPISALNDEAQALLAGQIAQMQAVDRQTLNEVIDEFCTEIEQVGLIFPAGLDATLSLLEGHLSSTAVGRLRRLVTQSAGSDPWPRIAGLPADTLLERLNEESVEVGAVILSKLPIAIAAELLGQTDGEKARALAYAVSLTGGISPDVVQKIGIILLQQLDTVPAKAFEAEPVERVGAILNQAASAVRDTVLEGLDARDRNFADQVRKAIFTFALIPQRIEARDAPRVLRSVEQSVLVTALAGAESGADVLARDFLLANIPQRLAASLREEIEQRGKVKSAEAETAQSAIVAAIRDLEAAGELRFRAEEE